MVEATVKLTGGRRRTRRKWVVAREAVGRDVREISQRRTKYHRMSQRLL